MKTQFKYRLVGAFMLIPRCRITSSKETSAIFSQYITARACLRSFSLEYGIRSGPYNYICNWELIVFN